MLTQGVTFLYNQAGELLTRRREVRDARAAEGATGSPTTSASQLPVLVPPDGLFAATPGRPAPVVLEVLEANVERLRQARHDVEDVVLGDGVDFAVPGVLDAVEDLRGVLEQVYGTDLTFLQERRERSSSSAQNSGTVGVMITAPMHTTGDVAGRDITKIRYVADR